VTWDSTPVEIHQKVKQVQVMTGHFHPKGALQSTHKQGESAAAELNTAYPQCWAVMIQALWWAFQPNGGRSLGDLHSHTKNLYPDGWNPV
jgi:hypothetical protein